MLDSIKRIFILSAILFAVLFITSCGDDKEAAKSMDEIQSNEGIPVKVLVLEHKPFRQFQNYYAKLSGVKETTKGAPLGGKVAKINNRIGDYVKEDQIIVEFPQDMPSAMYEQAKAAFENSEKTYLRMKALLAAGETSQANFDGVETQYLVNKRNYETQKKLIFIEAPFSGTIVDIKVTEGDNIKSETALFTVAQLNKVVAKIWVTEKEVTQLRRGMSAVINVSGKEYRGRVTDLSMAIDPMKQAFKAEIEFDNSRKELMSGITVEVKILIFEKDKAIVLPRNLVMNDENGQFVYVENNSKAEKRYIKNGMETGLDFEVASGLQPGDKLIKTGSAQLTDGSKVKVIQ